ncbi:4-hydroxybenzoate octaprenyltransferase [Pelagibacterium montanilacus]|uniref:4-hydroxybenzoate octaprenyltransferase n=1 Tax=Pelagibacterium montanilacus TaxID=2185280 RepID=UPI000F8D5C5F|nr:4-hydroxybenzoate octaprenyltransferase [Pelagibacterium montanilacus]
MNSTSKPMGTVSDAPKGNWVDRFAPDRAKPYLRMSRLDRPIGYWLLFWPCAMSLALVAIATDTAFNIWFVVLFLIGAIAMRGAGCTFNDIVDRDIDDKVERTRSRPIPSGQVSVRQAAAWLVLQALVGLAVLVQFNGFAIVVGLSSLGFVAIYPFMKRITYWPQLFLGLAFSWGALMGWAAVDGALGLAPVLLYFGAIAWTIGYDTVYALQDIEDDALIGVKSTALLVGARVVGFVALFYGLAMALWLAAGLLAGGGWGLVALVVPATMLGWQVARLDPADRGRALFLFKFNRFVGLAMTLALLVAAWIG